MLNTQHHLYIIQAIKSILFVQTNASYRRWYPYTHFNCKLARRPVKTFPMIHWRTPCHRFILFYMVNFSPKKPFIFRFNLLQMVCKPWHIVYRWNRQNEHFSNKHIGWLKTNNTNTRVNYDCQVRQTKQDKRKSFLCKFSFQIYGGFDNNIFNTCNCCCYFFLEHWSHFFDLNIWHFYFYNQKPILLSLFVSLFDLANQLAVFWIFTTVIPLTQSIKISWLLLDAATKK